MSNPASSVAESVGWIGLTAGLIGSTVTIAASFFLEDYKRHRDRQTSAMSYLGEIQTLVTLSRRLDLAGKAQHLAEVLRPLDKLPEGFGTTKPFSIPNPVFDKSADRIGLLPGELPMWISEFYNYVIGLRLGYFDAIANGPALVQSRVAMLDFVAEKLPEMLQLAERKIIPELRSTADRWWWPARAFLVIKAIKIDWKDDP